MSRADFSGPLTVYGNPALGTNDNPDLGAASLFFGGIGLLDQRAAVGYNPGQGATSPLFGWLGDQDILTINYVPSQLQTNNIAAANTPVSGTPLTLVSATGAGITVAASVIRRDTNQSVSGLLVIDAPTGVGTASTIAGNVLTIGALSSGQFTPGQVLSGTGVAANTRILAQGPNFGLTGNGGAGTYLLDTPQTVTSTTITGVAGVNGVPTIPWGTNYNANLYNPICMVGRNVRLTTGAGDTAVYTAVGFDAYGYPMSEAITANGATTVSGKKAFKYIQSITPVGTVGGAASVTVGTGDVYGFPLFSATFQDVFINWNAGIIVASTGYLAGVLTTPATTTTGDVRGTYAVQSASDGTKRLYISQSPPPTSVGSMLGLFGVLQT